MDKRNQLRPLVILLPFALMLLVTVGAWLMVNSSQEAQESLLSPEIRRRLVAEGVEFAIDALRRGDSGSAEKSIADAVQVQGGNSDAVVVVTEELIRLGQPEYAATFLNNACKQTELNRNPMLWATLARAQELAGNHEEAVPALTEAARHAEVIVFEANKDGINSDNMGINNCLQFECHT